MVTQNNCNTYIGATANNEVTMPAQPAFLASLAAGRSNVTGDGTNYVVVWGTEVYDQNNDFDNTSTFTAPVTGRYKFDVNITRGGITSSHNIGQNRIYTSNTGWLPVYEYIGHYATPSTQLSINFGILADMDAADTCVIHVNDYGAGLTIDVVEGGATDPRSFFSGYLVC